MTRDREDSLRLIVNAEGRRVDAAILCGSDWIAHKTLPGNAVERMALVLRTVLEEADVQPATIGTWIYSGGPGSLLGLRSLAMLLATWETSRHPRPITRFRFSGMVWAAREIQKEHPGDPFVLISPWRTQAWNLLPVGRTPASESALEVIEGDPPRFEDRPLYVLGDRLRASPPPGCQPITLPPMATLARHLDEPGFLVETQKVEPIQSGTTEYKKWTPSTAHA